MCNQAWLSLDLPWRQRWVHLASTLACLFGVVHGATAWAAPPPAAPASLVVGIIVPATGPQGEFGMAMMQGVQLGMQVLRQRRPDLAARVKFYVEDEGSSPRRAEDLAKTLLFDKKADILVGSVSRPSTRAIAAVARAAEKPLVAPTQSLGSSVQRNKFVFQSCVEDGAQGRAMAEFALTTLKARTAAVLTMPTTEAMVEGFASAFQRGGGSVVFTHIQESLGSAFGDFLTQVRRRRPEVIYAPGYAPVVGRLIKEARGRGFRTTLLGSDGWDSPSLVAAAGGKVKGLYFTTHFSLEDADESSRSFVDLYRSRFGGKDPTVYAALGFDAIALVVDAFERAGTHKTDRLVNALVQTTTAPGVSGAIGFRSPEALEVIKPVLIVEPKSDAKPGAVTLKAKIRADIR